MKSLLRTGAILLLVQAFLVGAYYLLRPVHPPRLGVEPAKKAAPTKASGVLPPLELSDARGPRPPPTMGTTGTLVHVWATWCPPCRDELPGLLSLADAGTLDVVAISLDREWKSMEDFFDGRPPPQVLLGDPDQIRARLKVSTLPVTFLVGSDSRLKLRFDGAQDWGDQEFTRKWLRED